jgi:RNA polymerase sigma factor (TIGR02999 family)
LAWSEGDQKALEQLTPIVYQDLERIAHRYLRGERAGHTLETAALVNEAYLRLVDWKNIQWQNRAHFLGVAAQMMRRILVDFSRSRRQLKRAGNEQRVTFNEALPVAAPWSVDLLALDDALKDLSHLDPRKARIVELRFFGGLSVEETAAVLQISPITTMREWKKAKAWLLVHLSGAENDPGLLGAR